MSTPDVATHAVARPQPHDAEVRFSVDLEELAAKVEEMGAFEAVIEEALHHADQVVARLHLTWVGQAALAHVEAHRQWAAGLAEMRDGLAVVRAAARRAHDNYSRAAHANAAMWAALR